MPRESLVERFYCDFADNPLGEAIHPRQGRIAVPQGPGLGVDPDPQACWTSDGSLAGAPGTITTPSSHSRRRRLPATPR